MKNLPPTRLKILRTLKGWRQRDVAAAAGVPAWKVSLIERGLPADPDELNAIEAVLKNFSGFPCEIPDGELYERLLVESG